MAIYYDPLNFDPDFIFRGESRRTYAHHDLVVSDDPDYDGIALNAAEIAHLNNHYDFSSITVDDLIAGHTDDDAIAASAAEIIAIINSPVSGQDSSHYIDRNADDPTRIRTDEDDYDASVDDSLDTFADLLLLDDADVDAAIEDIGIPSFFTRLASHSLYFVGFADAWRTGTFRPDHFATHCATTSRARRYHGIEDIVLDDFGRVRGVGPSGRRADGSPRRRPRVSRRVSN